MEMENPGQAPSDILPGISCAVLKKSYFMATASEMATRLYVQNSEANRRQHHSMLSSANDMSDLVDVVLASRPSASPETSYLRTPSRKGPSLVPGAAQIDSRRRQRAGEGHSQASSLSPKVLSDPVQVLANSLGLSCYSIPVRCVISQTQRV